MTLFRDINDVIGRQNLVWGKHKFPSFLSVSPPSYSDLTHAVHLGSYPDSVRFLPVLVAFSIEKTRNVQSVMYPLILSKS